MPIPKQPKESAHLEQESARVRLIELTNGTFGPWLKRLNAKGIQIDTETAIDVWIMVSKLVVEHVERGRHLNRKQVGSLLGASSATNRRRLEVCDSLGLLEPYTPNVLPDGTDKRPTYTRPTKDAIDLVDSQCRDWVIGFGTIQHDLKKYYGL